MADGQITPPVLIGFIHFIVKEINSPKGFPRSALPPWGPGGNAAASDLVSLPRVLGRRGEGRGGLTAKGLGGAPSPPAGLGPGDGAARAHSPVWVRRWYLSDCL